jgi:hypothetical protein
MVEENWGWVVALCVFMGVVSFIMLLAMVTGEDLPDSDGLA